MISNQIIIKAKITFKTTEEGGRKTGVKSEYFNGNRTCFTSQFGQVTFSV